jgi:hypothetical protein
MSLLNSMYRQQQEEASSFYNDESSRINEFRALINKNSKSSLLNFPSIPFAKTIYGCYEANSQFNYGFSPEFDLSLVKKHDLPVCDQVSDILAETSSQPSQAQTNSQLDRVPIINRLSVKYLEAGIYAVLEDLSSMSPVLLKKSLNSNYNRKYLRRSLSTRNLKSSLYLW